MINSTSHRHKFRMFHEYFVSSKMLPGVIVFTLAVNKFVLLQEYPLINKSVSRNTELVVFRQYIMGEENHNL